MAYSEEFEDYWKTTAKRDGKRLGKREAQVAWQKEIKDGADPEDLLRASKAYTAHCNKPETFANACDPVRFLRKGMWEDFLDDDVEVPVAATTKEIASAYWRSQGADFAIRKLETENPPDFCFKVPQDFIDQFKNTLDEEKKVL